jgi:hypothetical protein
VTDVERFIGLWFGELSYELRRGEEGSEGQISLLIDRGDCGAIPKVGEVALLTAVEQHLSRSAASAL